MKQLSDKILHVNNNGKPLDDESIGMLNKMTDIVVRHQWFMDRIGKTIYRNGVTCDCKICTHITDYGLVVQDEMHADYLEMVEATPDMEVRYFDTMEEVLKFKQKS